MKKSLSLFLSSAFFSSNAWLALVYPAMMVDVVVGIWAERSQEQRKRSLNKEPKFVRDEIDKMLVKFREQVDEMKELRASELENFKAKKKAIIKKHQEKVRQARNSRMDNMSKIRERCKKLSNMAKKKTKGNESHKEQCNVMKIEAKLKEERNFNRLDEILQSNFNLAMNDFIARMSKVGTQASGKRLLVEKGLEHVKSIGREYVDVNSASFDKHEKDLLFFLDCLAEIERDASARVQEVEKILIGQVCLEVHGAKDEVHDDQKEQFNRKCAAAIELACETQGIDMRIFEVDILDQYLVNNKKESWIVYGGLRKLASGRTLRMKIGASYQCFCNDGSEALQSDVTNRRRDLLDDILEGQQRSTTDQATIITEHQDRLLSRKTKGLEEMLADSLGDFLNGMFARNIEVRALPCSEMETKQNK